RDSRSPSRLGEGQTPAVGVVAGPVLPAVGALERAPQASGEAPSEVALHCRRAVTIIEGAAAQADVTPSRFALAREDLHHPGETRHAVERALGALDHLDP